jgi:hypothetical protein
MHLRLVSVSIKYQNIAIRRGGTKITKTVRICLEYYCLAESSSAGGRRSGGDSWVSV